MDNTQITEKTITFVKHTLKDAEGGHDWFHIQRVFKNAMLIAKDYSQASPLIVALGALLHDIADSKFHNADETIGPKMAEEFLNSLGVESKVITQVIAIINNISFKGGNFKQNYHSLELEIVQDADRLDAIGAIGIARCFNYGGFKNRKLYDPQIAPNLHMTKEQYKNSTAPTINHFYEKLLLLKERMNTETGKKLAQQRHDFMELYLEQFYAEIDGER
ncbi:hydrolase [Galbibacter marinus]|uniref:Hydrolase n=1 Tax=Galbibacter marinus TaxID=555500 RepID=K2PYX4_9FLAO|nr:HD domain-containing protein [Galbibacter marinus]EKF56659.1 hydrolase [Galbibacter marinus]